MVKRSLQNAFTLVEMMITLVIVASVLSLALITMRGYIPKQNLITTAGLLDNLLQQAQTEANARSYWTCIKFTTAAGSPTTAKIWVDKNSNHAGNATCGDSGDIPLASLTFKTNVSIATGSNCGGNITSSCAIWFDTTGVPKLCNGQTTTCGTTAPSSGCVDNSYQIVLSSDDIKDTGLKAREVEVLSGGMIKTTKPDDKGLVTASWANSLANPNGCE